MDKANEDRAVKLRLPAPSTFNKIVTSVPAIRHLIARDGPNLARQSLAMVSQGPRYTRIGEHMEMDFWEGHLMALFKHNGAWANLEDEVKAILKPIRVYIALVFDVCTGCIMGLSFSLSESSEAALTALRMVVSDRSAIAAWAGCQRDWLAPVRGDRLQTDGGSPFKSPIFWTAAATCFLQVRKKAGAHKRLNGHVERIFQTMDKQLMANFTGRTFSNVVDKGDYNPEARAALIVDELAKCVIRYVVDDYHLTKPDAPLAQSPYRKFWRLYREKGFKPPPSKDRLRASFGIRKKVELDRWGIRYANLFYTRSTLLEDFLAEEGEQMVTIMVDPLDLGEISVKAGRKWIAVGGPPEVRGIGVHEWEAFNRYMERQYKAEAELDWPVVAEALQSYDRVRGEALERAGIKDLQMTSDKMDAIARSMRLRFVSEARLTTQDGQPRSVARGTVGKSVYPSNRPQLPAPTDLADSPTSPPPFSDVAEAETIIPVESVDEQSSKPSKGSWGLLDD
ncbi:MAG: DDE-type integrase/transposase/recombinase [Devosia sp.]|uniref:hypothetical protein n=1 Tax=Devosia sp. TaxID=1871048 RepID=UPI001A464EBE|nr:hypothetical protein [Devosia sp.]MBL8598361.1 DDE-type integrase/transposase/recombinase [Devosia sp.]